MSLTRSFRPIRRCELAALVTRDAMIGVAKVALPQGGKP